MRRTRSLAALLAAAAVVGCGAGGHGGDPAGTPTPTASPVSSLTPAPIGAYCDVPLSGVGTLPMEDDYLPHVVHCENGGAGPEALRAQAIASRSYAYYKLETSGSITDGQGDQVYTCPSGGSPSQADIDAVHATAGQILVYHDDVIAAFYVAGAHPSNTQSCVAVPGDSDAYGTEQYVTYNQGKSGDQIEQTTLGYVDPTNYRNRGCMSQWGSRCLDDLGADHADVIHFYYGEDIVLAQASGPCVNGVAAPPPPPLASRMAPPAPEIWRPSMRIGASD